jgi:hypothetical protein
MLLCLSNDISDGGMNYKRSCCFALAGSYMKVLCALNTGVENLVVDVANSRKEWILEAGNIG